MRTIPKIKRLFGSQTFALCMLGALLLFYLWFEHKAHLMGALPYLILLACPLMHFWGHGGQGQGEGGKGSADEHKGAGCH